VVHPFDDRTHLRAAMETRASTENESPENESPATETVGHQVTDVDTDVTP